MNGGNFLVMFVGSYGSIGIWVLFEGKTVEVWMVVSKVSSWFDNLEKKSLGKNDTFKPFPP